MSHLDALGWCPFFSNNVAPNMSLRPARVVEVQRSAYRVVSESGESQAQLTGRFRHTVRNLADWPAVGDWVLADEHGSIHEVLPRKGKFSRKAAGVETAEQVVAANIDFGFLLTSLNSDLNTRRIERYLGMMWESGAQPIILLTKADLCSDTRDAMEDVARVAPAVQVHAISVVTGSGLTELDPYLQPGCTIVLLGSSGVGKSTLTNYLLGRSVQKVADIREDDDRGRHATTTRRLFVLPGGAMLIDTPGLREIQLWEADTGLANSFEDIERLAEDCRFRDCRHESEPGCAVQLAIQENRLDSARFENYLTLRRELNYLARKQDVVARAEENKRWKRLHKAQKEMYRLRNR